MYTLVEISTKIVRYTGLSQLDFDNGNYDGAGEGLYSRYLDSDVPNNVVELNFEHIRRKRDELLRESDYRDLPSYPGTDQTAWRKYRQKLRDIPQDYRDVEDVVFPDKP